jgi:hypothetical protein
MFIDKADEQGLTDIELMQELEELESKEESKKADTEVDEIERRFRELEIPDDDIIIPIK